MPDLPDDAPASPSPLAPGAVRPAEVDAPGVRLGLPAGGPGSVARPGRRLLGILADWCLCLLIAHFIPWPPAMASFGPLIVLLVENSLALGLTGASPGHRLVGLRLRALDGSDAGLGRAGFRSGLLCLFLPAVIFDRDQRGLHDQWAGTVLVRAGWGAA